MEIPMRSLFFEAENKMNERKQRASHESSPIPMLKKRIASTQPANIDSFQVYFGFSHCPDICPDELDKMARMIDIASPLQTYSSAPKPQSRPPLLPIFITCDPARDTPSVLKSYLAEFHPAILGLTGTYEQVKQVCKAYRVYFSTPEGVKPGMDYLVDHSIYFYLMGKHFLFSLSNHTPPFGKYN